MKTLPCPAAVGSCFRRNDEKGVEGFEADGGEALEGLVAGVDFDANGFQGRDSQDWLAMGFAENDCGSDEFSHELDSGDGDAHAYLAAVGQLVNAIPFRLHSD